MFTTRMSRRTATVTAVVGAPALAAGLWMANTAFAEPGAVSGVSAAVGQSAASKLPTNRSVMVEGPKTKSGARRILTVHHDTAIVDFARSKPDKKYNLITGGEVWLGLDPVGPPKDNNFQLVTVQDSEGGNVECVSMNSAGQISQETCEEVDVPGVVFSNGRDIFHFEKRGNTWNIQAFAGYLEAHKRQAGKSADWNTPPSQGFTLRFSPVDSFEFDE